MSQKPGGEMRAQINSWGVTDLKQSEDEWKAVVLCALTCVKVGYALFRGGMTHIWWGGGAALFSICIHGSLMADVQEHSG